MKMILRSVIALALISLMYNGGASGLEKIVSVTGEQARAINVAIAEFDKKELDLTQYRVSVYDDSATWAIVFDHLRRNPEQEGSSIHGLTFEVTVSKESARVVSAHFAR